MSEPSPMMVQYRGVKDRYPGHIVLFRVGDFFETFGEDAQTISRELEIVLTSRQVDGEGQRIPLAGVPAHAVESYLARLVRRGHRVVLCDQVEDAKLAKGLVRREVVRVVTPGTALEENLLPRGTANYLALIDPGATDGPVAVLVDISTGETILRSRPQAEASRLLGDVATLDPVEVLLPSLSEDPGPLGPAAWRGILPAARFGEVPAPTGPLPSAWAPAASARPDARRALEQVAAYIRATEPKILGFVDRPVWRRPGDRLQMDPISLRHLEITEPMNPDAARSPTLLSVVNVAVTSPGRRTVEDWVRAPLADARAIEARLDAVAALLSRSGSLASLRARLKGLGDLSRLTSRVVARRAGPRDIVVLSHSLRALPALIAQLNESPGLPEVLQDIIARIDLETELAEALAESIVQDPPAVATGGGVLRSAAFPELERLREAETGGRAALADLERREAEATGIKSLKIGYNQVFGYYFEVTRTHLAKVPADRWHRKQTLSGAERYTSEELGRWEETILRAREQVAEVEARLWEALLARIEARAATLRRTSVALGELDALASFAWLAHEGRWVRPHISEAPTLKIREGRHPILDKILGTRFVPNDTDLDGTSPRLLVLTGPNMAGKSTYMRQVGLLVVLAQAGCYLPAKYAEVGIVTSLATRMGFTDEIGRGKSSFMVEMSEVADILAKSDRRSLVLLDEVGRGTSTSDGLALAWAVVKYLHDEVKAKTLLATHYHQLAALVEGLPHAANAHLAVREDRGEVTFLRTLLPGATDKSYGLHVAALAGVPPTVLSEARKHLRSREGSSEDSAESSGRGPAGDRRRFTQALLVDDAEGELARLILKELSELDTERMTPVEALTRLHALRGRAARTPRPAA